MIREYSDLARYGRTGWKQFIFSILLILFLYFLFGTFIALLIYAIPAVVKSSVPYIDYISINLVFIALLLALFIAVRYIHKRYFTTLITPYKRINWRRLLYGFGLFLALLTAATVLEYFIHPEDFIYTLNAGLFFTWLPIVLILTPIQAATEELIFRGYVIQSFGLVINNKIILSLISGILFTLPHLFNPEISHGLLLMSLNYFAMGFVFAAVTLRSNSLEMAIGAHAANNLFAALLVNYEDSVLATNSVFCLTEFNPLYSLVQIVAVGIVFYSLAARITKREGFENGSFHH